MEKKENNNNMNRKNGYICARHFWYLSFSIADTYCQFLHNHFKSSFLTLFESVLEKRKSIIRQSRTFPFPNPLCHDNFCLFANDNVNTRSKLIIIIAESNSTCWFERIHFHSQAFFFSFFGFIRKWKKIWSQHISLLY